MNKEGTEFTLRELAEMAGITKPGMKKRLDRKQIAPKQRIGNIDVYSIVDKQLLRELISQKEEDQVGGYLTVEIPISNSPL